MRDGARLGIPMELRRTLPAISPRPRATFSGSARPELHVRHYQHQVPNPAAYDSNQERRQKG